MTSTVFRVQAGNGEAFNILQEESSAAGVRQEFAVVAELGPHRVSGRRGVGAPEWCRLHRVAR